jgi:hypothetical protein
MHLNLMTGALEGDDRIVEFVEAPGVTEGAMLHDALEAFNHGGWRGEIHICYPQRDKSLRDITETRAHKRMIPFTAFIAFTLNDSVEIKHNVPLLN